MLVCAGGGYCLEEGIATKREAQRRLAKFWKSMNKDVSVWACLRELWEQSPVGQRRALRGGTA
jgi:hypothetical protein